MLLGTGFYVAPSAQNRQCSIFRTSGVGATPPVIAKKTRTDSSAFFSILKFPAGYSGTRDLLATAGQFL